MTDGRWEAVKSGREVAYWRLVGQAGRHLGAVGHPRSRDGLYRALQYGEDTPSDNVELGRFVTKREAQFVVENAARMVV